MEILDLINKKFNYQYDFLRVLKVEYNTLLSYVEIWLLYPMEKELSDEQKDEISNFITQTLKVSCGVRTKFKKCYLEEGLIKKFLKNYLSETYPSMFALYNSQNIEIQLQDKKVDVTLKLVKVVYDYFIDNNLKEQILKSLNQNFIGDFSINILQNNSKLDENLLEKHEEEVYKSLPSQRPVDRYLVYEPEILVGNEITPMPEQICDQPDTNKLSVILAGKISDFVEKTYISHRNKKKGSTEPSYYYKFTLTDHTKSINAIYFSNKTTYKKVKNLKDGDTILVVGDIKKSERDVTLHIKSISFCEIIEPKIIEQTPVEIKTDLHVENYRVVTPTAYIENKQETIFDKVANYNQLINEGEFVVFDCETTGLSCVANEIIEIGAVKIINGKITEQFQTFIHPLYPIPEEITNITSITNEMVENAPKSEDAILDFYKFCEGCTLVGYNVDFDVGFIQNQAQKVGFEFSNKTLDCLALVRKKLYLPRYKLINVVEYLGLTLNNAHRAIADAIATAKVFLKINEI